MQETDGQQLAAIHDDVLPPDPGLVGVLSHPTRSTALDLGAGTGRIAVPLDRSGVAVTGAMQFAIVHTDGHDDDIPVEELFASRREPMTDGGELRRAAAPPTASA